MHRLHSPSLPSSKSSHLNGRLPAKIQLAVLYYFSYVQCPSIFQNVFDPRRILPVFATSLIVGWMIWCINPTWLYIHHLHISSLTWRHTRQRKAPVYAHLFLASSSSSLFGIRQLLHVTRITLRRPLTTVACGWPSKGQVSGNKISSQA